MGFDGKPLRDDEAYLASAQTIPQNTSAYGDEGSKFVGNTNGALCVRAYVTTQIALADAKVFTIKLFDSADDSTFAEYATTYTVTASGATTIAVGTKLGEDFVIPPQMNNYVKAQLVTTDAAATGAVDIVITYLDR
jgi:hypothetical protein